MLTKTKYKQTEVDGIPEGWEVNTIEESVETLIDYRGKTPKKVKFGIPLITAKIVKDGRIHEPEEFISSDDYDNWMRRGMPKPGDVVITTEAPLGEVAQLDGRKVALAQRLITLRGKTGYLDSTYLRFALQSPFVQGEIRRRESGTTVTGIKQSELRKALLPIPPFPEQCAIAKILSDLDAKIDLNRRMNETLEQMARAIFKQWFVDFEFPGHEKAKFIDDLPEGWREGCFGDILTVSIGGDWGEDSKFEGAVQSVSLRGTDLGSLKSTGYAINAPIRWIRKDKLDKRIINNRNILIGGSGLGPIGKTIYCSEYLNGLYDFPVTYSNFCKCLTAEMPALALFAEIVMDNMYLSDEMNRFYTGTSIPNLDVKSLMKYPIIIPSTDVVQKFYDIARQKFIKLFDKENILLAQIRDSLLPKLFSGEIRVNL